jgi:hypothetical protein
MGSTPDAPLLRCGLPSTHSRGPNGGATCRVTSCSEPSLKGLGIPAGTEGAAVCLSIVDRNADDEAVTWVHSYVSDDKAQDVLRLRRPDARGDSQGRGAERDPGRPHHARARARPVPLRLRRSRAQSHPASPRRSSPRPRGPSPTTRAPPPGRAITTRPASSRRHSPTRAPRRPSTSPASRPPRRTATRSSPR